MEKLIDIPAGKLLDKFGAGNHKPGSGSAAAYNGMLSAQLIKTVIEITTEDKRLAEYGEYFLKLEKMKSRIETHIYPSLATLFQKDSEQFDKAIKLRKRRDNHPDKEIKKKLSQEALQELKPATEMPIEIAKLCKELAYFAAYVFDNGYRAVRGDSGVALHGAVAAIGGCLAIIDLNLISFGSDDWVRKIRAESKLLRIDYEKLLDETKRRLDYLKQETDKKYAYKSEIEKIISTTKNSGKLTYAEIEDIVTKLQNTIWIYRDLIWKKEIPTTPRKVLNPRNAIQILGYFFNEEETLGHNMVNGEMYEIAGIIDNQKKIISISKKFAPEIRNFTSAHELGHALLHRQRILHRDRPLDGSKIAGSRDKKEKQAERFASYFLMPRKQVRDYFQELYKLEKFVINEMTAIALGLGRTTEIRAKYKNLRSLSKLIASTEYFNGRSFSSLAKIFNVSVEAMAIRLEELELVDY
jgi:formiminotetrahydrofolate cyclodeaminase/Zn-dependent peptidase ImmA (M78 family)